MPRGEGAKSHLALREILTRRPDDLTTSEWCCVSLGGTSLYARDLAALNGALSRMEGVIEDSLKVHLILARLALRKLVSETLREHFADRVFGAVLGRSLRFRTTTTIPCLTVNSRLMRVYLHPSNLHIFENKLATIEKMLRTQSAVSVEEVQRKLFPFRGWNTRFVSQQLLSHLAYRGLAAFTDNDLFIWPKDVEDAVSSSLS